MINRKTLLNELPSYGIAGNLSYAADLAKSKVGLASASTVQLKAMVSDLVHGVSGAPNRFFTWFSKNIGMSVGGIKKYLGSMWKSVGSSDNIFMKVIYQIGSAIGSAISYAVKLLSPLISQVKAFMGANISGLYGVTNGQLIVCACIFACIVFIIYKIYKRIKNRGSKKQAQPQAQAQIQTQQASQPQQTSQTPQDVVKESKEMLHDTMEAITEGIHTFKSCDYLVESLGNASRVGVVTKIFKRAGKISYELSDELLKNTKRREGFNIFEGDYDRGTSHPMIMQNKVFISTALLCIAVVLGFFAFTNLATGISSFFANQRSISGFFGVLFNTKSRVLDIQKIVMNPKVIGAAAGAGIAYKASKQMGPTREYR